LDEKANFKIFYIWNSCIQYNWILTVSSSTIKEYIFGKFISSKSSMIGNPLQIQTIREKAITAELKAPSDIVFLGRCSRQKNPFLLSV